MFAIFWPSGHDHDSQNQLFLTLGPPNYFIKCKKYQTISKRICLGISVVWKSEDWKLWERRGQQHPKYSSNKFLKIFNMGSISSRKDELEIWLWDQYLQENMKWTFCYFNKRNWSNWKLPLFSNKGTRHLDFICAIKGIPSHTHHHIPRESTDPEP